MFLALHGPFGEDGVVQALCEAAGLVYTGSGVAASAVGMDKALFKRICAAIGMPVVPWIEVAAGEWRSDPAGGAVARRGVRRGAARPAGDRQAGAPRLRSASPSSITRTTPSTPAARSPRRSATTTGAGRGVPRPSPRARDERRRQPARDLETSARARSCPATSSTTTAPSTATACRARPTSRTSTGAPRAPARLSRGRAYLAIGASGFARVDFLLAGDGVLYLNEINTIPGFTPISLFPVLCRQGGYDFGGICERIVELALERAADAAAAPADPRRPARPMKLPVRQPVGARLDAADLERAAAASVARGAGRRALLVGAVRAASTGSIRLTAFRLDPAAVQISGLVYTDEQQSARRRRARWHGPAQRLRLGPPRWPKPLRGLPSVLAPRSMSACPTSSRSASASATPLLIWRTSARLVPRRCRRARLLAPAAAGASGLPVARRSACRSAAEPRTSATASTPVDLAAARLLLTITPADVGSASPGLALSVDDDDGWVHDRAAAGLARDLRPLHRQPAAAGRRMPRQVSASRSLLAERQGRPHAGLPAPSRATAAAPSATSRRRSARLRPECRREGDMSPPRGGRETVEREAVLVAIDVGTSKVVALVGEVTRDGAVTIIGKGAAPSSGLKKGVVINIEQTVNSIRSAREAGRAAVRLPHRGGLRRRRRQPRREPELARRGRRQRAAARGEPRGHRAGHRGRAGGQHPIEPRGAARPAARLRGRRPGGRQGPAGHERGPARGRDAHRPRLRDARSRT